jgi:[histone H3]-lysine36 N-dimethyltransferase SETMAR
LLRKLLSAIFKMSKFTDQRICIKFCLKNNISATDTFKMLTKCFGDECLSRTRVFEWYKMFENGREIVQNLDHPRRSLTSVNEQNIQVIKDLVIHNRRITIRDIAEHIQISFGSIQSILKNNLGLRRVASRLVPKTLTLFEKDRRVQIAEEMISLDDSILKRIITGDETWIYAYDTETVQQSSEYRFKGEARPKKPRQSRSKIKVMLTVFFDYQGVVHHEFLPSGQTVNKEYYLSVMRRLREAIRKKRPDLWINNSWFLHHDNAPSHTAIIIRDYLTQKSTNVLPQAPYSPDMAPADFFLFPKLKIPLRGYRFQSNEEIQRESLRALKDIPKIDYQKCFLDWKKRWHKCIAVEGDYFEGDEINLNEKRKT